MAGGVRTKFVLAVTVILLPVLALVLHGMAEGRRQQRAALLDDLLLTSHFVGMLVDEAFSQALAEAELIAAEPGLLERDPAELAASFQRAAALREHVGNLGIIQQDGTILISALDGEPVSVIDRPYVQQAMREGRALISPVLIGRLVREPTVIAVAPIRGEGEEVRGLAFASLQLGTIHNRLREAPLREDEGVFLLDPDGYIALHTIWPELAGVRHNVGNLPAVQKAFSKGEAVATDFPGLVEDHDRLRLSAMAVTRRYGWLVGVSWPQELALAPVTATAYRQLRLFALMALFILLGTLVMAHVFTRPIRELAANARSLGEGRLDGRVHIRTGDELQMLGDEFNQMACALQDAERQRELFVSAVAHEMRNLVSPALLSLEVQKRRGALEPEAVARLLQTTADRVRRVERLVSDLLEISRLQSGGLTIRRRRFDYAELVRKIATEQQQTTVAHRIVVDAPEVAEVNADADRVAQVLTNLLSNAIKYSEGGEVRVTLKAGENVVETCVADQGIGLTKEAITNLFQPWRRFGDTDRAAGLGLGLYLCRAFVEAHGGTIRVDSEGRDRGATFCFVLPST